MQVYLETLCRTVARNPDDPASSGFRLEGWANVLRHGQYNSLHSHPNAVLVGGLLYQWQSPTSRRASFQRQAGAD
ncbi:MAG: hypothetical protein HC808_09265 [Candidatus Competibacteraceae bacterium]|nr:hypothetical protein [Candidatus Competibacteraceae bacterium]